MNTNALEFCETRCRSFVYTQYMHISRVQRVICKKWIIDSYANPINISHKEGRVYWDYQNEIIFRYKYRLQCCSHGSAQINIWMFLLTSSSCDSLTRFINSIMFTSRIYINELKRLSLSYDCCFYLQSTSWIEQCFRPVSKSMVSTFCLRYWCIAMGHRFDCEFRKIW